ncbi:MAG: aminotransferase class I/II-fold pyridoxal phosphate-dependent enzyme [Chloroflexi bacterium]|nr:aminotransferase class I/II-fold pyridoxal phosphate-dependent enzyme [Chloroflexota bacterium]MCL5109071.1 aminotransferase class I/II-fold pyridoxal phosphate-dependent enzyme [Chloroflexota bacterium]
MDSRLELNKTEGSVRPGWINLRSDVVTLPTPEMFEAIQRAVLGDDNKEEDPTTIRLEEMAAAKLGKEAAILLISGTMGNLVGVLSHTQRGQEIILEEGAHIFTSEQGGAAAIGGLMVTRVKGELGFPSPVDIEAAIRPDDVHSPRTGLICLENTHNRAGGTVLTPNQIAEIRRVADHHGLPIHIDGARFFNASVALGIDPKELAKDADSVTICLSKGLSCPAGSLLIGSKDYVARARRWRKLLGGTMRQAGVMAAPGIVALEKMVDRLAEDHDNARSLADGLRKVPGLSIDGRTVQTNMVRVDVAALGATAADFCERLLEFNVEAAPSGKYVIRLVTHRHIAGPQVEESVRAFRKVAQRYA